MRFPLLVLALTSLGFGVWALNAQPYQFSTLAGDIGNAGNKDGTNSDARFLQPCGIVRDAAGNFYIGDMGNNTIRKIARQGSDYVVTTIAGGLGGGRTDGTNTQTRFLQPQGVILDSAGNLYVADSANGAVRKIAPLGTDWVTTTIAQGLGYPNALTIDSAGTIYTCESSRHIIRKLTFSGSSWFVLPVAGSSGNIGSADGTNSAARFHFPNGLVVDSQTNIYVADLGNSAIRKISPVGTSWVVTTIANLSNPYGVALDQNGNLYVSLVDSLYKLTRLGTNWLATTISGANPGFNEPNALTLDLAGNLYVTDTYHNAIRVGEPIPLLEFNLTGGQLVLSWPVTATNYQLETAATLPTNVWSPLTNGIFTSGANFVVTNPASSDSGFYRLHR